MLPTAMSLDRYEILRELSKNGSGATYKAIVRATEKNVAVRIIVPGPATNPDLAKLQLHASRSCTLNSPYIVRSIESYEKDGNVVLAMDYAEGSLLSAALGTPQISDWDMADVARQLCSAIDHAASLGVFHQNLHPGNVLQEWDGTVKVLDYGVATDPISRAHANASFIRPLQYISPEQARHAPPDQRSNLFSLGTILYEMVTGQNPFAENTPDAIIDRVTNLTPPSPYALVRTVPSSLSAVLMKALSKSPDERYQTGAEFLYALDHYQHRQTVVRKPLASPTGPVPAQNHAIAPQPRPEAMRPVVTAHPQPRPVLEVPTVPVVPKAPIAARPAPHAAPRQSVPLVAKLTPVVTRVAPQPPAPVPHLKPTPRSEFLIIGPKTPDPEPTLPAPVVTPEPAPLPVQPPPKAPVTRPAAPHPAKSAAPARSNKRLPLVLLGSGAACLVVAAIVVGIVLWGHRHAPAQNQVQVQEPAPVEQPPAAGPVPVEEQAVTNDPSSIRKKKKEIPKPVSAPVPVTGNLSISSAPEGAAIEIDGQQTSFSTPHTIASLNVGSHTIRLSRPGYETVTRAVQVGAGQTASLSVSLAELRATVVVNSDPSGASISINGDKSGRTTPVTVSLLKGRYVVALQKQGFLPSESTIEVAPGQSYRISPRLAPLGNADAVKEAGRLKKFFGGGNQMAQMGKVQFRSVPKGAQVSVNGKPMKKQTPMELFFPGGHYEVVFTLPGYKPVQKVITVTENATQAVDVQLERESR